MFRKAGRHPAPRVKRKPRACLKPSSRTKDEVQRLAERTDALVTILASVDWEKIDPDLLHTRDNLEGAKAKVTALRNGEADADPEEVSREIEKLEAFVTSSKFAYYEKAARD